MNDDQFYLDPDVVARRNAPDATVCVDPQCDLSGGYAHIGPCEPCECGMRHAVAECPKPVEYSYYQVPILRSQYYDARRTKDGPWLSYREWFKVPVDQLMTYKFRFTPEAYTREGRLRLDEELRARLRSR